MIVLHYTGMQFSHDALARLCDPKSRVSSHYLVQQGGSIIQMVPEVQRAWHAGVASWGKDTDINGRSIGIEIDNPGHEFGYPDFPKRQIAAVITLCRAIATRHIVRAENVLAHSDVAPNRKQDPGEKFPWAQLARSGVGLWVDPAKPGDKVLGLGDDGDAVTELQNGLIEYGYAVEATGRFDAATQEIVIAFQRHFRPARVDGVVDASTQEALRKLLVARKEPPPQPKTSPLDAVQRRPHP